MTGRRILDAAALFKAARGVASKHVAFRTHQLDVYSKTSTLAKAVQSQTDRVTLTVKAATALTDRFNGPAPQYPTLASKPNTTPKDPPLPSGLGVGGTLGVTKEAEGLGQDYYYENPEETTTAEPLAANDLHVKQEEAKRHTLSDGSIPPVGTILDASESEGEGSSEILRTVIEPSNEENQRPELSTLPQVKVSKQIEESHQSHKRVADSRINQDVCYPSGSDNGDQAVPGGQAVPEQEQLSDEAYSEMFHSPRVARLLGGQHRRCAPSKGLELPGSKDTLAKESKSAQESDHVSSSVRTPVSDNQGDPSSLVDSPETTAANERSRKDVHALAADMANDGEKLPSDASGVSSEFWRSTSYSAA